MLHHIHIRNFAIVTELELAIKPGLTVLTGETGAGKSILLDALGLTLGDRADSNMVGQQGERAEIIVSFSIAKLPDVEKWLEEHEMESDDEVIIRRTINRDGRSKGYINGSPAPLQQLKELGEMLVDIHGQHSHQSLQKKHVQRQLLDEFANNSALLQEVGQQFHHWQRLSEQLTKLEQDNQDRDARLELLRYQVQELDTLAVTEGEWEQLEEEHSKLANVSKLLEGSQYAVDALYENEQESLISLLGKINTRLDDLAQFDAQLSPIIELLGSANIQLEEAAGELRHYMDRLDIDPERFNHVEQRIAAIHELARKHQIIPSTLHTLLPQFQEELDNLEQADDRLSTLRTEIKTAESLYTEKANKLSQTRGKAAEQLGNQVSSEMSELGMAGGQFEVTLLPLEQFSAHGLERVEFMVSANPGQPLKALTKVASGGELSRISLAIQVITASAVHTPTLIFDEVDVGIGGGIAEIVGRKLRALGENHQVLCVTHQPQVAALGQQHMQVYKEREENVTNTRIDQLDEETRIYEIARMLGGVEITDQTLSHAKEMLHRSAS